VNALFVGAVAEHRLPGEDGVPFDARGAAAMSEAVGAVKALWRFPVKSMRGEQLEAADVTETGLVGDRAYALIDPETGKVMSGKNPRLGPNLLGCRAAFVEAPQAGAEPPPVRITLPTGTSVRSDAPDVDAILSASWDGP
jgi:hypothetical protein